MKGVKRCSVVQRVRSELAEIEKLNRQIHVDVSNIRRGEPLFKNFRPKNAPSGARRSFVKDKPAVGGRRHTTSDVRLGNRNAPRPLAIAKSVEVRVPKPVARETEAWQDSSEQETSSQEQTRYFRLKICKRVMEPAPSQPSDKVEESDMLFESSHCFLSLPDPSACANEFYAEAACALEETVAVDKQKRPWSSPARMRTKMRHGMLLEDAEGGRGIYKPRRLPCKSKLIHRMSHTGKAFRKWKTELIVARDDEAHYVRVIQRSVRRWLFKLRIRRRRLAAVAAQKIIKNFRLGTLARRCRKRANSAAVVRSFCVKITEKEFFFRTVRRFRWSVVQCQRWVRSWLRLKRTRLKVLGKLFDNQLKQEFKKTRSRFNKYVDRMVKSSDVRVAMKEVADIKERFQKCHIRCQKTLIFGSRRQRALQSRDANIRSNDELAVPSDVVVASKKDADEGEKIRKRLAALQYLRDHFGRKLPLRKKALESILLKYRKQHQTVLVKLYREHHLKKNMQRTVTLADVQRYVSGQLDDGALRNTIEKPRSKPMAFYIAAKKTDIPCAVHSAVEYVLEHKGLIC